jgi:hypothetical protein
MTRMERLKQEAREAASLLGHRLGHFRQSVVTGGSAAATPRPVVVAACANCGALVVIDPAWANPAARITGEGVLRQCFGIEQEGHETA